MLRHYCVVVPTINLLNKILIGYFEYNNNKSTKFGYIIIFPFSNRLSGNTYRLIKNIFYQSRCLHTYILNIFE